MGTIATLDPTELTVEPGSQAVATVRVRNTGSIVDRFDVDVVGATGDWVKVDPPSLSLFPGAEGTVTVTFGPPRASMPRAGTVPFGIRVRPAANPAASTVEEGRITVAPFGSSSADIAPQTSRGGRGGRHEVLVDNKGNAPVEVVVTAADPDRRLTLEVSPQRAIVRPDDRAGFRVVVRVDDPFPFGPNRPRPFVVNVEPGRQGPIQLRATLNQQALLPSWLLRVAGIALAAVAIGAMAFVFGMGPFAPKASPTPAIAVVPTTAPTEEATTAGTESDAPSQDAQSAGPPTPSPTPEPFKPKDFTLSVTGDSGELGADLQLRCAADDKACRNAVKDDVLALVGGLKNQYTGAGITSTRSIASSNALPIVMSSDREFPWTSEAGQTGVTTVAVIDLGPLLAQPAAFPYVVVTTPDGLPHRFVVDASLAQQLFDKLYVLAQGMPPVVAATPDPGITIFDPISVASVWDPNRQFLLMLPLVTPNP